MPEMATLDAFFNKIERPANLPTAAQQKCNSSSHSQKKTKNASRKRGRVIDVHSETRRLKHKRQKPLDTNLNVSDCRARLEVDHAPEVVSDDHSCGEVNMHNGDVLSIPSPTVEISYEEFLTCKGIAHVETNLDNSEDADTDVIAEVNKSPIKASLNHSGLASEPPVDSLEKNEHSPAEDEDEDSDDSEVVVASKDIRSFFSKADKVSPQPVNAATLMKIKVDIHCEQSEQRNISSKCVEGHMKRGSELARSQRAAIVITDDDLDIEVIGISRNDEEFQIDFPLEDNVITNVPQESNVENHVFDADPNNTSVPCSEVSFNTDDVKKPKAEDDSVCVDTVTSVAKSVKTATKLKLRTATKETKDQANEEAVSHNQKVNSECEDKYLDESDDVIIVDEKVDEVDCDTSSTAEPSVTGVADEQSTVTLTVKSTKPNQVQHF